MLACSARAGVAALWRKAAAASFWLAVTPSAAAGGLNIGEENNFEEIMAKINEMARKSASARRHRRK
jgi:hypothetical protein